MIVNVLGGVMTYLAINSSSPTVLQFQSNVEYFSIGKIGDYSVYRSNNGKVLVLNPIKRNEEVDLVVLSKDKSYSFRLKQVEVKTETLFEIRDGLVDSSFELLKKNENFEVWEGKESIFFKNQTSNAVRVNGQEVKAKSSTCFGKNNALYLGDERLL